MNGIHGTVQYTPAELYAETPQTFAQLRPVSIFPEEADNSNSSVSNTMGFTVDRLKTRGKLNQTEANYSSVQN